MRGEPLLHPCGKPHFRLSSNESRLIPPWTPTWRPFPGMFLLCAGVCEVQRSGPRLHPPGHPADYRPSFRLPDPHPMLRLHQLPVPRQPPPPPPRSTLPLPSSHRRPLPLHVWLVLAGTLPPLLLSSSSHRTLHPGNRQGITKKHGKHEYRIAITLLPPTT